MMRDVDPVRSEAALADRVAAGRTADATGRAAAGAMRTALETVVVIPCYNEARRLPREALREFFSRRPGLGVVFVDDGSRDATAEVLTALCADIGPHASLLRLPANQGKAEAVRLGLRHAMEARPRLVAYWDADLATPLDMIPVFEQLLVDRQHLLMVLGARIRLLGYAVERLPMRHYTGRVFATAASLALRIPVYDTQCGAKMFRVTDEIAETFATPFMSRWIFDVEILARLLARRRRDGAVRPQDCMHECPLPKWEDVRGSKLTLRDYARAAVDLWRIWWRYCRR